MCADACGDVVADVDDVDDGAEADGDSRISSNICNNVSIYISMQSKIISISPSHIISRSKVNRGSGGRSNQKKRLSHSRQESLTA